MPGLQAFCVSCAIAIGAVFLLQTSWFVAWLSIDQRRIEERRNGIVPCIVHEKFEPPAWSQKSWGQIAMMSAANLFKYVVHIL